jgi:tetratricopeptide (TPR) repeat protein
MPIPTGTRLGAYRNTGPLGAGPELAYAHEMHGWYLVAIGETEAGLAACRRAVALDPLSSEANAALGFGLYFARRYDDAIRQLRTTITVDPDYLWGHEFLGRTYIHAGRLAEAVEELGTAERISRGTKLGTPAMGETVAPLGLALAAQGDRAAAAQLLADLTSSGQFAPTHHVAVLHLALGDRDRAVALLERADPERSYWSGWMGVDPDLDPLRSDPRFAALVKQVMPTRR